MRPISRMIRDIKMKPRSRIPLLPEEECLAKTQVFQSADAVLTLKGCSVRTHLRTTCRILQELRKLWSGYPLAELILPEAEWLAALHDIGKLTPSFQEKIHKALDLPIPWTEKILEGPGGHAGNSGIILEKLYGPAFARLAGSHHGIQWFPSVRDTLENEELGGPEWQAFREKFLESLCGELNIPECDLRNLPEGKKPLILGAAILADWLSSGMDLPYEADCPSSGELQNTIIKTGMIPPHWKTGLSFEDLFGFSSPNSLQKICLGIAEPGNVYIIESGMGSGKTEAALCIAAQLMDAKQANGIYFAMPTQLTSEKIYDRLNAFLQRTTDQSEAILIHGDSWLNWSLPESNADGMKNTLINSWFQTKKRALLAPFAAGTVDQALLSVVNVRHKDLRAFALAGKVLILDEVHSYDSYTGSLLSSLICQFRQWGGTVIILSATLTSEAKRGLLGTGVKEDVPYPLISVLPASGGIVRQIPVGGETTTSVTLRNIMDEKEALSEAAEHASRGEQVLWIENTVADAQDVYRKLAGLSSGMELGLIHSRFPVSHRREQEGYWVDLLGRKGAENRKKTGRILVATQVLEQSVDVDSDFLITRLAPGDMLFQRIGRLWRHRSLDAVRPASAKREAVILIPPVYETPEALEKKHALPYDPYWMLRTYRVWKDLTSVKLPEDIRPVLENIYRNCEETGPALALKGAMEEQKKNLERLADISQGSALNSRSDEEAFAGTRYSERETVQLLLLRKANRGKPLRQEIWPCFCAEKIVLNGEMSRQEKLTVTGKLLSVMIKVPVTQAPAYADFETETFLGDFLWTGEGSERPVRAAYVDETGELLNLSGTPVSGKKELFYHEKLGLCARKKEGEYS